MSASIRPRLLTLFVPALLALQGCENGDTPVQGLPLSQKVAWSGHPAARASDSALADTADPASAIRIHRFHFPAVDGGDLGLTVWEYRADHWAFAAWSRESGGESPERGAYRRDGSWHFIQGRFFGRADTSAGALTAAAFRDRLVFAGEQENSLPALFSSFPLLGRIPQSERMPDRIFLGHRWNGPVFSAEYQCHGDTALAFRANPQPQDSLRIWMRPWKGKVDSTRDGREWTFRGVDDLGRPMVLENFSDGIAGFSGCYDPVLEREYVEKMKKTQVFWHKP